MSNRNYKANVADPMERRGERGYRGSELYTESMLGRPQFTRVIPLNATSWPATQNQYIQFTFGQQADTFLAAFKDGCMPYLDFTLTATRADGTGNGFCVVEPWRAFDRVIHSINDQPVNNMDINRAVTSTLDLLDRPVDYLQTEGSAMGVDVMPGSCDTPFSSAIDLQKQSTRIDGVTGYSVRNAAGDGATGVYTPFASSNVEAWKNGALRYGTPKRFRIPLDLLISGPLSDPESLVPYAAKHRLELYMNAPLLWAYDVPYSSTYGTDPSIADTASQVTIQIQDVELYVSVCSAFGWLRDETRLLVAENRWMFRTEFSKCIPQTFEFAPNTTASQGVINYGLQPFSLKSLEACIYNTQALNNPAVGSKSTLIDNGVIMWQYRIGMANTLVPAYPARCGYQNPFTGAGYNQLDGYILYNNFRSAKCSQQRDYRFAGAGCINNLMYDGTNHFFYDAASTYDVTPRAGYYSTVLPTLASLPANLPNASYVRANVVRAFKMAVDLQSASNSEEFVAGSAGGQIWLNLWCNGLLSYYYTNASSGVLTYCTGSNQVYLRMRTNAVIFMGLSTLNVLETIEPGMNESGQVI